MNISYFLLLLQGKKKSNHKSRLWIFSIISHFSLLAPSTTIFQALRIAVNDEFKQLDLLFNSIPDILERGGVAVFLCFHSLEIKRVKMWMRRFLDPSSDWRQEHAIENQCVLQ